VSKATVVWRWGGFAAVVWFLLGAMCLVPDSGVARASLAAMATPAVCPVTTPNGKQPPAGENVFGRGPGGHGTDELWTNLWTWGEGVVDVPPTHVNTDGSLGEMKWPWWRGVSGRLAITGHRLDGEAAPLRADVPEGYGEWGFIATGLTFPTAGCWEVTGRVGEASLTFVVRVRRVDAEGTPVVEEERLALGAPTLGKSGSGIRLVCASPG
jgi:hypothetical protein